MTKLTIEELESLAKILEIFEAQALRDTGMKWVNGGYAKADMFNYDDEAVDIQLEWGEQNMGDGKSYVHQECYTLKRNIITSDIDILEKIDQINN